LSELAEHPRIDMSPGTAAALRQRGGILYVWADKAGMVRARTNPPVEALDYDTFSGNGWSLHVDRGIAPAHRWLIKWRRLPWPHFRAFYNPVDPDTLDGIIDGINF
jgi:hypothetical protein